MIVIISFHHFCPMNFQHVSLFRLGSYGSKKIFDQYSIVDNHFVNL
jgi:hypothetical protein